MKKYNDEQMLEIFNKLIDDIKSGVVDNKGNKRLYDILDYYQVVNIEPVTLFDAIRNKASKDDIIIFKKFLHNNPIGLKIDELFLREVFGIQEEINTKRDEKGLPIPGTGRIITNEEKKMVFDYIIENKLPATLKIYKIVLKRYINGEIDLENQKKHNK